jgi:hypothetical protein
MLWDVLPRAACFVGQPIQQGSNEMPMTILICGSPAEGFQIVGLFPDRGDAESYAEDHCLKDWWVARLISPQAFAESRWKPAAARQGPS